MGATAGSAADAAAIAVVGAGLMGRRHIDLVRRHARLAAIADPAPEAQALAAELGVAWFASVEECLEQAQLDGAIIATPNRLHLAQALACLEAGVPALIEKPVTETAAEGERLVEALKGGSVPILVGHHRRHNPLLHAAARAIREGAIGRVVTVAAQFWLYKPDDYFDQDWRCRAGGGPIYINLVHDVDALRHLCGEIVRVEAVESSAVRGLEVEDTAAVILGFESGALGTVSICDTAAAPFSWEFTAGENPAYPRMPGHCYAIGGTEGTLTVPDLTLWRHVGKPGWWEPMESERLCAEAGDAFEIQMLHFLDVAAGRAAPAVTVEDALGSLRVIERIKESASRRRRRDAATQD